MSSRRSFGTSPPASARPSIWPTVSAETVRDARQAAEQAAHRIAEATRDAAERLREVGKGALESMRARTELPTQEAAPVEERSAVPIEDGKEPAGR